MGCLAVEGPGLVHGLDLGAFPESLVGRYAGVRVGVVGLDSEPVEVFHEVHLHSGVGGVSEVHRGDEGRLPLVDESGFDGVLELFPEEAHHELLR